MVSLKQSRNFLSMRLVQLVNNNEHVYSLKAEINTENTINKKVKGKLYTNGQNKKNTNNTQI